ncbi:MAG: DsbA family protein [Alphaproteobacteria bacterium]|nr:DsbA family protein [Alphaproteobacteria bacterium]
MHLYRRIGAALVGLMTFVLVAGSAQAQDTGDTAAMLGPRVIGSEDAPVTVIEYFSLTCPHCAAFHNGAYAELKEKYVDTGKVKFVYRDFPLDGVGLRAAMMARCVDEKRYPGVIQVLFKTQENWARSADPVAELQKIGALAGLGAEAFESCVQSDALANGILAQRQEASAAGVRSTPTFEINGRMYPGSRSIEEFDEILEPLLAN